MKAYILAILLAAVSITSLAGDGANFGKIEYAFRDYDGNVSNQNGINLTVGREVAPGIVLDANTAFRTSNGNATNSNRFEIGATYSVPVADSVSGYIRGGLGYTYGGLVNTPVSGNDYTYFAVEPGINYTINKTWIVGASCRFRDAFSDSVQAETHQAKFGAAYALTDASSLTASFGRSWGDAQYNSLNLGYAFKF